MTQDVVASLRPDPKELDVVIGSKVRGRMAEKSVTQEVIAHVLGLNQQGVSKRLNGIVPFKVNELFIVADVLGMTVSAMLDEMTLRPSPTSGGMHEISRQRGQRARRGSDPRPSDYKFFPPAQRVARPSHTVTIAA